ncbi:MAG: hypothetical protein E7466_01390 [Ruminococcaceae bacterium]|nr:hypothetical protein [Oscillospiraceae bacterium]
MKSYDERTKDILSKAAAKKKRRKMITGMVSLCCCMVLLTGLLLLPNGRTPPRITDATRPTVEKNEIAVQVNPYTPLINAISPLLKGSSNDLLVEDSIGMPEGPTDSSPPTAAPDGSNGGANGPTYEEITDNQVEGVTEADLIKRSDKHIFYLRTGRLTAYSIEGLNSRELGSYEIGSELTEEYVLFHYNDEMYLSTDCRTVTIITNAESQTTLKNYLYVVSLDVTNPENITLQGSCFLTGSYRTSRLTDNGLYLVSAMYVPYKADWEDKATFLPGYGTLEGMTYLPMEDICIPNEPHSAMYTIVSQLDSKTLDVVDTTALLSYAGEVYMSRENIYLSRSYSDVSDNGSGAIYQNMTEVTRLRLDKASIVNCGSFCVAGSLQNQYSMDEYQGILRLVTTTSTSPITQMGETITISRRVRNASLYCIDLTDHSIRAKVESFAPEGESVRSVRFDGDTAYVCTSIQLQDPVFFFDLSDLDNIRWKDTGTIDGFSMSLVDFAPGYLMGIGYGNSLSDLKIEMYREGQTTVESHCVYEYSDCYFSTDYKSYYIDRNHQFVGLAVETFTNRCSSYYLLLHFDGTRFVELVSVPLEEYARLPLNNVRAVYIDGFLYVLSGLFQVVPVP